MNNRRCKRGGRIKAIVTGIIIFAVIAAIAFLLVLIIKRMSSYTDNRASSQIEISSQADISSEIDPHEGMELITIDNNQIENGSLMLVNGEYGVPSKYEDADYPSMYDENKRYYVRSKEMYLQPEALEHMKEMLYAAADDGITNMLLVDGYRLNEKQELLFSNRVKLQMEKGLTEEEATAKVAETVAFPGHSEHQIGLAIDTDLRVEYDDFEKTEFAVWLAEHCHEYGFILRYPQNKEDITKISYEPWHFRYVGKIHAEYIMKNKICLEEYIQLIQRRGAFAYKANDGVLYTITYAEMSGGDETECWIPENSDYEISSDNAGGFVVLSWERE